MVHEVDPTDAKNPVLHFVHWVAPAAAYVLAEQILQVAVVESQYVPEEQVVQLELRMAEKVPVAQEEHEVDPVDEAKELAGQLMQ